jgi:hypothetical protein
LSNLHNLLYTTDAVDQDKANNEKGKTIFTSGLEIEDFENIQRVRQSWKLSEMNSSIGKLSGLTDLKNLLIMRNGAYIISPKASIIPNERQKIGIGRIEFKYYSPLRGDNYVVVIEYKKGGEDEFWQTVEQLKLTQEADAEYFQMKFEHDIDEYNVENIKISVSGKTDLTSDNYFFSLATIKFSV